MGVTLTSHFGISRLCTRPPPARYMLPARSLPAAPRLSFFVRFQFAWPPHSDPLPQRSRHFKAHRTVPVQLLADIERLGPSGTILHVAPGYMRNSLFPRGKARYLAQEGPALFSSNSPTSPELDVRLQSSLLALPEIMIEKNARPKPFRPDSTESLLYHPVTMEMVAEHLRETFEINHLHPPYALLTARTALDGSVRRRLMSTGPHTVEVKLRNGSLVPLRLRIQRKSYGQQTESPPPGALTKEDIERNGRP